MLAPEDPQKKKVSLADFVKKLRGQAITRSAGDR